MAISDSLRQQVIDRAGYRCEYCKTSSRLTGSPLVMDHICPISQGGQDSADNLAAACYRCNEFKGARTGATDPQTQQFVPLFNPRRQQWREHFHWDNGGTQIIGITSIGRATIISLRLNNDNIVAARAIWTEFGWHPPKIN
ncbi:HNH endonuclease signature motif containing protein [Alkalinema sp. FACHB-956]|uniref:HNH endonuclease n=1 Tax=Alkalinema sp. FACHB-956 TaxID=2692768 RepID=UPI0016829CDB|nr:HNH endonuclease signature motif containing protein [Alkalinema sp. FACHB-956]MBD2328539.1 HNH endonuclease [Alkalinema sp. FACHB-956]